MAGTLAEHYAAVLADLQDRREKARLALRELETDINRIQRLAADVAPTLSIGITEHVAIHATEGAGKSLVVRLRPDFSRMSVRWAALWLLSEYESGPMRTPDITNALTEGGYKSGSGSFMNAV